MRKRSTTTKKFKNFIDRREAKALDKIENDLKKNEIRKRFLKRILISYKNDWRKRWDYLIMLLAMVNCIMVPLEIAVDLQYVETAA